MEKKPKKSKKVRLIIFVRKEVEANIINKISLYFSPSESEFELEIYHDRNWQNEDYQKALKEVENFQRLI